jgi:fibronectin-binding autotransporter adhesin
VAADTALFDDSGALYSTVNIPGSVQPGSLTVNSASNYVFAGTGVIGGSTGLTKTNSGTLTITTTNNYTGATVVNNSTLAVSLLANGGSSSSIGAATAAAANLILNNATLQYLGGTVSTDRGATLGGAGGTLEVTNSAATLTLNSAFTGSGAFTKSGPGAVTFAVDNAHTGGTVIQNGVLRVNTTAGASTGGITNIGGTLRFGSLLTLANSLAFSNTSSIDHNNLGGNSTCDGAWNGDGAVAIYGLITGSTLTANGSMANFIGSISLSTNAGTFRFNSGGGNNATGNASAAFDLGSGSATIAPRNGGVTIDLGEVTGGASTKLAGRLTGSSGTVTYSVGGKNTSATFNGTVIDSVSSGNPTALTKVGTGNWTITGTSTFTGNTTVSAGTLTVNGINASSAVTVGSGGTLGGNGRVASATVQAGGTVAPGTTAPGKLTVAGIAYASTATNVFDFDVASSTNDIVQDNGSLTPGGSKLVINITGGTLASGAYRLINYTGSKSGSFDSTVYLASGTAAGSLRVNEATNGQINLVVNSAPVANADSFAQLLGLTLKIKKADLLANDTDVNGDTLTLDSLDATTTNGVTLVTDATYIYLPTNNVADAFNYTVVDGYGGTNTGTVNISVATSAVSQATGAITLTNSTVTASFSAIPGYSYTVQRATNATFTGLISNFPPVTAAANGAISVTDDFADLGGVPAEAYYRLQYIP